MERQWLFGLYKQKASTDTVFGWNYLAKKKRQEINTNNYIMSFEWFKYCSEAESVLVSTENSKYDWQQLCMFHMSEKYESQE